MGETPPGPVPAVQPGRLPAPIRCCVISSPAASPARSAQLKPPACSRKLKPAGAVAAARHELAAELVADLVRLDGQRHDARQRIATAVTASKTTLTELFGVGRSSPPPSSVTSVTWFASLNRDHFAAYDGTAPIEVSSGGRRKVFRLSRRGNRRLNHAIHMAAVTQIRFRHTEGRAYYDRKIAEGHSGKEATRALKRRIERRPLHPPPPRRRTDSRRHGGPRRALGERLCRLRGRLPPRTPALRPSHSRTRHHTTTRRGSTPSGPEDSTTTHLPEETLDTKRTRSGTLGSTHARLGARDRERRETALRRPRRQKRRAVG